MTACTSFRVNSGIYFLTSSLKLFFCVFILVSKFSKLLIFGIQFAVEFSEDTCNTFFLM